MASYLRGHAYLEKARHRRADAVDFRPDRQEFDGILELCLKTEIAAGSVSLVSCSAKQYWELPAECRPALMLFGLPVIPPADGGT